MSALDWGWAGRAYGIVSGDQHVVVPFSGGALVALLDGLGHGPEAAEAALAAQPVLELHASDPVIALVERCHETLHTTRGAVMSVASFDASVSSMTWAGVGNVAGILLRAPGSSEADRALATRAGVVGFRLPPLRAETLPVFAGDTLILATDGIRGGFSTDLLVDLRPQELAESILARFARDSDDAHVVVARWLGEGDA